MTPTDSAIFSGVTATELPAVRVIEDGDVRTVIEAVFGYGRSAICMRYLLPKRGTELGLDVRVLWLEKTRMLKLSVPAAMPGAVYLGQVAYGAESYRRTATKAVAQKWVAAVDSTLDQAMTVSTMGAMARTLQTANCD